MTNADRIDQVLAMARRGALTPDEKAVCDELEDFAVNILSELEAHPSNGVLWTIPAVLHSGDEWYSNFTVPVEVRIDDNSVSIRAQSIYGNAGTEPGYGEPIVIENYYGDLHVLLWNDINQGDPTHAVLMNGAREEYRRPDPADAA